MQNRIESSKTGNRFAMLARIHRQRGVLKAEFANPRASRCVMTRFISIASFALGTLGALGAGLALIPVSRAQGVSLTDEIIADPVTGAALLGFDPVAYFIANRAVRGDPKRQTIFAGRVWYFASSANKNAFEANPGMYLPAFGGYDPVAIAAGIVVAGSPEFFAVENDRLFLFRQRKSRDAFLGNPGIHQAASLQWPQVRREMVPEVGMIPETTGAIRQHPLPPAASGRR